MNVQYSFPISSKRDCAKRLRSWDLTVRPGGALPGQRPNRAPLAVSKITFCPRSLAQRTLPTIWAIMALLGAMFSGCAHAPLNVELNRNASETGYRVQPTIDPSSTDGLNVALFFSGGGTRSAAFSYGVLQELASTRIANGRRMLDAVSTIQAASGGSFTAAYYCLYGDKIFADYERLFLKHDVQDALIRRWLAPGNFVRLCSPWFGRSDLAAEYYDQLLFHGATFGDLIKADATRPFLVINATNLATFTPLPFTQDQFDLIGSDLSRYPISRAVAASSAVPLIFTPIVLKNYADKAPPADTPMLRYGNGFGVLASYQTLQEETNRSYLDVRKHPYFYLVDGGVSDNLSLHFVLDAVMLYGGWEPILDRLSQQKITKLAIIVVDAAVEDQEDYGPRDETPNLKSVVRALTNASIQRRNQETIASVEASLALWRANHAGLASNVQSQPTVYFVRVDFRSIADPALRSWFLSLPTSFKLPAKSVDRLVAAGRTLLKESPEFQRLLRDLTASHSPAGAAKSISSTP